MDCPLCFSNDIKVKFIKNSYPISLCRECKHVFTNYTPSIQDVEQIYSDDYFFNGGVGYDNYILEKDIIIKRGEYYAKKISKHTAPGKVLDIGSAAGFILKGFENKGWFGTGIEPNRTMVDYAKNELNLDVLQGTIEHAEFDKKFDLIVLVQVIAHIFDLHQSIKKISNLLNPNGLILIETWDKDSLTSKIFGSHWHEYSPPSTLNFFSRKTLNLWMRNNNFLLIDQGVPIKKILSQHAKSLLYFKINEMKYFKGLSVLLKLIPDNLSLPYPSEDLFWALYQKQ